jgi:CheY-like chemotaxis protein
MKSIRVIGLTDTERHAFNSVVRLSLGRNPHYTIWQAGDGRPDVLLLDGQHADSAKVAQSNRNQPDHMLWLGADVPEFVHYSLQRPLKWMALLQQMDTIIARHAPTMPPSDFVSTLSHEEAEATPSPSSTPAPKKTPSVAAPEFASTLPMGEDAPDSRSPIALSDFNVSGSGSSGRSAPVLYLQGDDSLARSPDKRKRVLIVDANTTFRLYLKAVLSVGNELLVEETADLQEALTMAHELAYDSVLIDMGFAADGAFSLCKSIVSSAMNLRPGDTRISRPNVYFLSQSAGPIKKMQAKRAGANGILIRPRNQAQLDTLFTAVNRYAQG